MEKALATPLLAPLARRGTIRHRFGVGGAGRGVGARVGRRRVGRRRVGRRRIATELGLAPARGPPRLGLTRLPGRPAPAGPAADEDQAERAEPEGLHDRGDARELEHDQRARDRAEDAHERREQPNAPRAQRQHHEQERHAHRAGRLSRDDDRTRTEEIPGVLIGLVPADHAGGGELVGCIYGVECPNDSADGKQQRCRGDQVLKPVRHPTATSNHRAEEVIEDAHQEQRRQRREDHRREVRARLLVDRHQQVRDAPGPLAVLRQEPAGADDEQQRGKDRRDRRGDGAGASRMRSLVVAARLRRLERARGGSLSAARAVG